MPVNDTDTNRRSLPQPPLERELEKCAGHLAEVFEIAEEAELERSLTEVAHDLGKDATVKQFLPLLAAHRVEDSLRQEMRG